MITVTFEQMRQIVEDIQGTCRSLEEIVYEVTGSNFSEIQNDTQLCDYVYNRLFECPQCGWRMESADWCDNILEGAEDVCSECAEEKGWV